jgi:hypothetical protein
MEAVEFLGEIWKWIELELQPIPFGEQKELWEARLGTSSKGQSLNSESDFRAELLGGIIFGEADDTSGVDHNLAKYILVTDSFSKKVFWVQVLRWLQRRQFALTRKNCR